MRFNSIHLHIHTVALLSPLFVLFWLHLSFLKTKTEGERIQVAKIGEDLWVVQAVTSRYFFLLKCKTFISHQFYVCVPAPSLHFSLRSLNILLNLQHWSWGSGCSIGDHSPRSCFPSGLGILLAGRIYPASVSTDLKVLKRGTNLRFNCEN